MQTRGRSPLPPPQLLHCPVPTQSDTCHGPQHPSTAFDVLDDGKWGQAWARWPSPGRPSCESPCLLHRCPHEGLEVFASGYLFLPGQQGEVQFAPSMDSNLRVMVVVARAS